MRHLVVVTLLTGCLIPTAGSGPGYQAADPAQIKAQQRASFAKSMGYPTKKSAVELDQTIAAQTQKFRKTSKAYTTQLEAPQPFTFDGVSGSCYTVVMHLGAGAAWDIAGDYTKFDFQRPEIGGSGGPGVVGPGAVASVGCAKSTGPITLTMASMLDGDPIGKGPITMELYARVLTRPEIRAMEQEEQRQIAEQRQFAEEQRRRDEQARQERDREFARSREQAASRSSGSSSGGSSSSQGPVSVTIRSSCPKTAPVFYGSKPKFGSGTQSSISTNSVQSHSFRVGDMFWVTDASGNGLDGVTVTERTRTLEIDSSCSRISER